MVPIKTLLPDLKKLVVGLFEDLLARAQQDDKVDARLREAFQQIEKGGRTAQAFEVWREDYLDQVAVAWVLACVFVRFMEDNYLIEECWLAGEGDRRRLAEGAHELKRAIDEYVSSPRDLWSKILYTQIRPDTVPDKKLAARLFVGCAQFANTAATMVGVLKWQNT